MAEYNFPEGGDENNDKFDIRKVTNIGKMVGAGAAVILGIMFVLSCVYTINPDEVGVIQRFGKFINTTSPGLHLKLPWGIDRLTKVKTQFVYKQEFGYATKSAGIRTQYSETSLNDVSLMLTGDLNIGDVNWSIQFKIQDPAKFLFNVRAPIQTLRDASEAAMRSIVGDRSVDEVLTIGREEINRHAQDKLQMILDGYETGIKIVTVELQDVNPPEAVKASFDEVNKARQQKETMINQAQEAYNKVIPKARGQAQKTISSAEGYASQRVNEAKGDADRFVQVHSAYANSPTVVKRRLYIETMSAVFKKMENVWIVDDKLKNVVPLLQSFDPSKVKGK